MIDRICISINNRCNLNCRYCHFHEKGLKEDEFDLEQYRSNRRYYMHTQPIPSSNFEDDENEDDSKTALYKDFIAMYTTDINEIESASWWMEELDDSRLIKVMNMLTPREKEVVSLMVQDEMSMQEVGDLLGINKGYSLATAYPELASEWHPTKNGELLPNDITPGAHIRVWWKCKMCGHSWQAMPKNRIRLDSGCPNCASAKREELKSNKQWSFADTHPELLEEWDYLKNLDVLPTSISAKSKKKM